MKTIDELGISKTPLTVESGTYGCKPEFDNIVYSDKRDTLSSLVTINDARLIAAAPELLVFAVAYYKANKKNAVKINPTNGDKFQSGLMLMCKEALVKAGIMDKSEVWDEEANNG